MILNVFKTNNLWSYKEYQYSDSFRKKFVSIDEFIKNMINPSIIFKGTIVIVDISIILFL
jgi:hypothetical protein